MLSEENDDPDLAEQVQALKARRSHSGQEIDLPQQASSAVGLTNTNDKLTRLVDLIMRQAMASSDPNFRKAFLRLFVDTVTVTNS